MNIEGTILNQVLVCLLCLSASFTSSPTFFLLTGCAHLCECVNSQKVVTLEGGSAEGRELGLLVGIELVSGIRIFLKLGSGADVHWWWSAHLSDTWPWVCCKEQ